MTIRRYAKKVDGTQKEIVQGLRECGVLVWIISEPCDLLTYYPPAKRFRPLECKPLKKRKRKDQKDQDDFLALTHTPVCRSFDEALEAVLRV